MLLLQDVWLVLEVCSAWITSAAVSGHHSSIPKSEFVPLYGCPNPSFCEC